MWHIRDLKAAFSCFLFSPHPHPLKCTKQRRQQSWACNSKKKNCFQDKWNGKPQERSVHLLQCPVSALPGCSQICHSSGTGPMVALAEIQGLTGLLLGLAIKMLLSLFICRWPPNDGIPHCSLSRIANMRRSLL